MATRQGRAAREFNIAADSYETLFAALFITSCTVDNIEQSAGYSDSEPADRPTAEFILRTLYTKGAIAYSRSMGLWLPFAATGARNVYGVADNYTLSGANGYTFIRPRADIVPFLANPNGRAIADIVRMRCKKLADFDSAIGQNLDAVKDMSILLTDNQNLSVRLMRADAARRRGEGFAVVNRGENSFGDVTLLTTGAEYKIDKLLADRRAVYEETLHLVNVYTPVEKGERLIVNEVSTNNAETAANGNVLLRTFNGIAEQYDVPFRIRLLNAPTTGESEQADENAETPAEGKEAATAGEFEEGGE